VIVALLTDFGTRDHYVGAMKGVVLSVCPEATLVDITHDVAAHDVLGGALELAAAFRFFPPGTVFLAVVDPGVGSSRRGIAAEAGGYRFVGPDNGLLALAWRECGSLHVVELGERKYARPAISATFEGRDRFAPAAGWLARGTDLRAFGPPVPDPVRLELPQPSVVEGRLEGEVLRLDRFGNLITNIDRRTFDSFARGEVVIEIAGHHLEAVVSTYSDVEAAALCALIGSTGYLEVAVNGGSAAAALAATRGMPVAVTHRER
jgi:S-adenosylmethionine hydrolase